MIPPRRVLASVAVCLLLTACTSAQVGTPVAQPSPGSPASAPDAKELEKFTTQKLAWGECAPFAGGDASAEKVLKDKKFECAHLSVPLDYAKPAGEVIKIAVLRHRASKPDQRIGSLVTDPGGPGASGVRSAAGHVQRSPDADIVQRFDLVGFDPRGVGASEPRINCLTDAERDADRAEDSESDNSPAGLTKQLADAKAYADKCAERTEHGKDMLANLGTRDVVRDLDILRAALGDEKLTYLGYSYGTQIGAAYAEAYPSKVRAMVLDGAVDPAQDTAESLVLQMAGFQNTFNEFAKACVTRPECALGKDPAGATKAFQDLVKPLITKPIQVGARKLSFEDAITGTLAALYSQAAWSYLNEGLANLSRSNGQNLIELADSYYDRGQDGTYAGIIDVYYAVRCVDSPRVTDRAKIDSAHQRMLQGAPILDGGTPDMTELDICAAWPVPATSQPHTPKADGLAPTLVISTTNDPATPYQAGVNLAKALNGRLLTFEGAQHTVYLQGNTCVDKAASTYLLDGTLPADGTRC